MSDLHRARARADAFARAIDNGAPHGSHVQDDDPEFATAVDLVARLRAAGAVSPRPEFSADLRRRLLDEASLRSASGSVSAIVDRTGNTEQNADGTTIAGGPATASARESVSLGEPRNASVTDLHRHRRRPLRLVASTATIVLLAGGVGSAAAAQQSMPGDALYGMKRGIETVATNVSVGDDSRGRRELEHAMTRLAEVRSLAEHKADVDTINATLNDFSVQARRGVSRLVASYQQDGDEASLLAVNTFLLDAATGISSMTRAKLLPDESLRAVAEAWATIESLANHTKSACPKCLTPKAMTSAAPTPEGTTSTEAGGTPSVGTADRPSSNPTDPLATSGASTAPPSNQPTKNATIANTPQASLPTTSTRPTDRPTVLPTVKPTVQPTGSLPPYPTLPTPTVSGTPQWPFPTLSFPTITLPLPPLVTLTLGLPFQQQSSR
jgi:hypothetical protein